MVNNLILDELLSRAINLEFASKGNIQLYNIETDDLTIVAQNGFEESFLKHFYIVKPFDTSACGRAFGIGSTVFINNTHTDISFVSNKGEATKADFRAVKSVPVFSKSNKCVGIISTHFKDPKSHWDTRAIEKLLPEIALELEKLQNFNASSNNTRVATM
jgi:hypothetical protein